jgi:thymidylate kinase
VTFERFVTLLIGSLRSHGLRFCVLRNWEGLPHRNTGSDLDLLIDAQALARALTALRSLPAITITAVSRRPYVTSIFLHGVAGRCFQVDLWTDLAWRGLEYIDTSGVLDRVRDHPTAGDIPVPDPVDEAVVSFFTSYVIGGFVKTRYAPVYLAAFRSDPETAIARVAGRIDPDLLREVFGAVSDGRDEEAIRQVGSVRRSLLARGLARRPWSAIAGLVRHFAIELGIHLTRSNLFTLAIFGPDGAGKSSVAQLLVERLANCSKSIELRHLRPALPGRGEGRMHSGPITDPHGRPPKARWTSHLQLAGWVAAYWLDRLLKRKDNATLHVYDRYIDDVLVDPRRYRYGGSRRFARAMAGLAPRPDLVVILDAPAELLQARKQEVTPSETTRQCREYQGLARGLADACLFDASRPLEQIVDEVERLLLRRLAARSAIQDSAST